MSSQAPPPLGSRHADGAPHQSAGSKRPRFQFSTASLLGVMSLVAVVCAIGMTVPSLLAVAAGLIATAAVVAYAGFLVAGAMTAKGEWQLFMCAAGVGLLVSIWGVPNAALATYFLDRGGMSPVLAVFVWSLVAPVQHIALSLFGGWIALRSAEFFSSDETATDELNARSAGE